jgi:MFS family permease
MQVSFPELKNDYGLLSGPAFSISYAFSGLFMGILADSTNRKWLLITACSIWSLSTMFSGMTNSFAILFIMRFVLGICVSTVEPAGYSILADYFPPSQRATANSILGTGGFLGGGSGSLLIIVVSHYGWRFTYLFEAAIGFTISGLAVIFVKEPRRGRYASDHIEIHVAPSFSLFSSIVDIMKHPVARWNCAAAMFRFFGIYACDFYYPFFFLRTYPEYAEEFALTFGLIVLICGFSSSVAGGLMADNLFKENKMTKAWICFIGNIIAMPLFLVSVLTTTNFHLSLTMAALKYITGEVWKSPNLTMM